MEDKELKALVSLLEDDDNQVVHHVEDKIRSLGHVVIPYLEKAWEENFNPLVQQRLEELVHEIQFSHLQSRLEEWRDSPDQDLLTGMWLVATYQYPDLELSFLRQELEQLYYEAWLELKPQNHPYDQVKILNSVVFGKLKFSGNTKNFHSPSNSMINIVLESRKGNPISLCVVYMLIAQKLKMPVYGVNLPNLFILTYKDPNYTQFYINAYNRGLIFSKEDIDNYISELRLTPDEMFYQPCTSMDIVLRVFRNLINSFEKLGEHQKSEEVKKLMHTLSFSGRGLDSFLD
jgi:regulator of sirC expression with transglutaminase-like and TPR domain